MEKTILFNNGNQNLLIRVRCLGEVVGDYEINAEDRIKITRAGSQLFVQIKDEPKEEIFADKESTFFVKDEDVRIRFKMNSGGLVIQIILSRGLSTKIGDKISK